MDIIQLGDIALMGTSIIAEETEQTLIKHFPKDIIDKAKDFGKNISHEAEAEIIRDDAVLIQPVDECGIYGALWELSKVLGVGFDVNLRKIMIRQVTIEICEYYKINPYRLLSRECFLIVTNNGTRVVNKINEAGANAVIIGATNDSNDKKLLSGDETRYLDRVRKDALYKVIDRKDIRSELLK